MIPGSEALARLQEGNRRFVSGRHDFATTLSESRRLALAQGQEPFAVVLGCADSRVPAEIVFGQGLGDLFVIRVAGNVVAPSQIGSVEFAAARLGTRLVVVLGHTHCGAIAATLEQLRQPAAERSPHLQDIVDRIRPAVEPLLATGLARQPGALAAEAVRANVRAAASQLRHRSAILVRLIEREGLLIVAPSTTWRRAWWISSTECLNAVQAYEPHGQHEGPDGPGRYRTGPAEKLDQMADVCRNR